MLILTENHRLSPWFSQEIPLGQIWRKISVLFSDFHQKYLCANTDRKILSCYLISTTITTIKMPLCQYRWKMHVLFSNFHKKYLCVNTDGKSLSWSVISTRDPLCQEASSITLGECNDLGNKLYECLEFYRGYLYGKCLKANGLDAFKVCTCKRIQNS